MSKKAQKKRHTKPCRYFQVNKCHHPAEVCDFAHVISTPPTPLDKGSTMCRYFLAGRCTNGQACKYQHGTEGYPVGHPTGMDYWPQSRTDPAGTSPTLYGNYPVPYGHVQPSRSFNPTATFPSVTDSILFAPPRSQDSIDTASTSISSLDSDEVIVVTNDPKYTEHPHSHQSQVYVADDSPIVHVPPFFPGMHMNLHSPSAYDYGFPSMITNAVQTLEMKPRPTSRPMSKQKTMKYKTKPCKFFTMERGCPNDNSCTFIHDENRNRSNSSSPVPVSPVKYPSLADETDKRNFFPVAWRVIGGGVRVAVAKEDEKDPTSSTIGSSSKPKPLSLPPLKVPTRQRSNSIPSTSNTLIHVEHLFSAESPGVL